MALTKNDKEKLLDFIKSHYVDYHDVRLFIAKDLEKDISQQMKKDEKLSFKDALKQAYKKYGVIGFSDVSEDYMKKIEKHFKKKVVLKAIKDEVSKTRFWLFAIVCFLIVYAILRSFDSDPFVLAGCFILIVTPGLIFYFFKLHKESKTLRKKDKYYYLEQLLASNNSILLPLTQMPLIIATNLWWITEKQAWAMALLAFFTMISFSAFYLIYFKLYKDRYEIIQSYQDNYLSEKLDLKLDLI